MAKSHCKNMTRYLCDTCQDGTPCCSWTISSWNGYKCETKATVYLEMPKGLDQENGPYCHEHALQVAGFLVNGHNTVNLKIDNPVVIPVGLR